MRKKFYSENKIPEYKRLGIEPKHFIDEKKDNARNIKNFNKFSSLNQNQQQKINQVPKKIEELEKEENDINHDEIYEDEVLQTMANVVADAYSYLVVVDGKCLEILPSKTELEEFLDKMFFEERVNPEILQKIEIWKKLPPFKFGISIID